MSEKFGFYLWIILISFSLLMLFIGVIITNCQLEEKMRYEHGIDDAIHRLQRQQLIQQHYQPTPTPSPSPTSTPTAETLKIQPKVAITNHIVGDALQARIDETHNAQRAMEKEMNRLIHKSDDQRSKKSYTTTTTFWSEYYYYPMWYPIQNYAYL